MKHHITASRTDPFLKGVPCDATVNAPSWFSRCAIGLLYTTHNRQARRFDDLNGPNCDDCSGRGGRCQLRCARVSRFSRKSSARERASMVVGSASVDLLAVGAVAQPARRRVDRISRYCLRHMMTVYQGRCRLSPINWGGLSSSHRSRIRCALTIARPSYRMRALHQLKP